MAFRYAPMNTKTLETLRQVLMNSPLKSCANRQTDSQHVLIVKVRGTYGEIAWCTPGVRILSLAREGK
jgi:hypothetical protein